MGEMPGSSPGWTIVFWNIRYYKLLRKVICMMPRRNVTDFARKPQSYRLPRARADPRLEDCEIKNQHRGHGCGGQVLIDVTRTPGRKRVLYQCSSCNGFYDGVDPLTN